MSYFEHASAAVELGFSVLPIGSNKKPLVEWKQYQTDPPTLEVVQAWEDEFAPWGWGFIVGAVSGIIVVDGDGEEGAGSIAGMGLDPHVATSKGGVHVYVTHPGEKCWNAVKFDPILYPGVDLKGDGGYVRSFCPGVQWLQTEKFEPVAFEQLPERVREGATLGKRGYQRKYKIAGPGEGSHGGKAGLVPDGTRRDFLLSRAGFMHNNGIDEAGLILRLRTLAIERCEGCEEGPPPDLEAEIVKIATDAQTWERHVDKFPLKNEEPNRGRRLIGTSSDDVEPETVTWFWKVAGVGWIPYDALSVLVGDPGEGKGLFATWLTAYAKSIGTNVGILGHEDSKGLQRARLDAAESGPVTFIEYLNEDGSRTPLSFPSDVGALREAIERFDLGLIIVDPINSHMDEDIRSSDDKDVRRALSPLAEVAQDLNVMIVCVHHMSKGTVGQKLLYRSGGAQAYSGVARQVLALGKKADVEEGDEDELNARYLFQTKSNYARQTNVPLKFQIEERAINVKTRAGLRGEDKIAAFDFVGPCEDVDQMDVFSPPRGRGAPKDEGLRAWIDKKLDGKTEIVSSHLEDAASAEGLHRSWRTIKSIMRDELDWKADKVGSAWVWRKKSNVFLVDFANKDVIEAEVVAEEEVDET